MTDQPTQINPLVANIQKTLIELIEFGKKRQWTITNYSALIYAAIFGIAHSFHPAIRTGEKLGLCLLVLLTWQCTVALLIVIQSDTGRYRKRLEDLHNKYIDKSDRETLGIKPYGPYPALRGAPFLAALIGVVSIGAGLVIYSIWRT